MVVKTNVFWGDKAARSEARGHFSLNSQIRGSESSSLKANVTVIASKGHLEVPTILFQILLQWSR